MSTLSGEKAGIPWDQFTRKYGELREIGAGRRLRERPDRSPVSVTETLFYKALIGRAFFETNQGLREYAYIPEEFFHILNSVKPETKQHNIKPYPSQFVEKILLTNDIIIDNVATVLAGLRIGLTAEELTNFSPTIPLPFLIELLKETKLITDLLKPSSEKVKQFLETDRGEALGQLAQSWKASQVINELDLLDSLEFEGQRTGKSQVSRDLLLHLVKKLPDSSWFGIKELVDLVYKSHPDILRSGGEFDAWFIKNRSIGDYINGFENWLSVEGLYIHAMILKAIILVGIC